MRLKIVKKIVLLLGLIPLASCQIGSEGSNNSSVDKDVPIYEGMSISYINSPNKAPLRKNGDGDNGNHYGHGNKPEKDIHDVVEIEVGECEKIDYFVKPNEPFIVEVHISNPMQYEIQSFTLNGAKYASYMFEKGSTMECLLLQMTAPSVSGYYEYTIDAIKYIEGTSIKDVDMRSGNKTIKAGVSYRTSPSANVVSSTINVTSAEFEINVKDPERLIQPNSLAVYLSDGKEALYTKELVTGVNRVTFSNIKASTIYEFGVACVFDFIDNRQVHSEWILEETFETKNGVNIINVQKTKDSISFDLSKNDESVVYTAVSLYDSETGEKIAEEDGSARVFNNILSNHEYDIFVDYSYISDGKTLNDWQQFSKAKTGEKITPKVTISNVTFDFHSVSGTATIVDPDEICVIEYSKIFLGENLAATNENKEIFFDNLESGTEYIIKLGYSFNKNDGKGKQNLEASYTVVTLFEEPDYISVNSIAEYYAYCEQNGINHNKYNVPRIFKCPFTVATMEYTYGTLYNGLPYSDVGCGLILEDCEGQYIFTSCISFDKSMFVWNPHKNYYEQCDYPEEPTGYAIDSRTNNLNEGSSITLYIMETRSTFANFSNKYSGRYCWCVYAEE